MNDTTQAPATQVLPETVEVDNLDQFVAILNSWHERAVKRAEHFLQVPEGQEIQIGDDQPLKLEGDLLRAFKAGVNCALMQLGTLPFAAELEADEPAQPSEAAVPGG
jgi:hypothetical protein